MPAFLLFLAPVLPAGGAFPPVRMVWQVVVVRVIGWCIVSRRRCEAVAWAVQLGDLVLHGGGGSERWRAGEGLRGGGKGGGGAGYVVEERNGAVLQRVLLDDLLNELEPEENGVRQSGEKGSRFATVPALARARVLGAGRTTAALQVLFCVTKRCPLFWCHMLPGIKVGFFF
jgi:hypothetical protein